MKKLGFLIGAAVLSTNFAVKAANIEIVNAPENSGDACVEQKALEFQAAQGGWVEGKAFNHLLKICERQTGEKPQFWGQEKGIYVAQLHAYKKPGPQ